MSDKPTLFAEGFTDFLDDLECLYIKGNQSGRIKFSDQYPAAAAFIGT